MPYTVYILASRKNGTLYIGVTNDIARRDWEHLPARSRSFASAKAGRHGRGSRFVKKHCVTRLVRVESHAEIERAIQREKTMKEWPRA